MGASAIFNACLRSCIGSLACGSKDEVLLPARIIDIGTERDETLRLCVTSSETRGKYVALAYCWGQSNSFVTTSTNFELLQYGFPLKSLPGTLRDAVELTRKLGLRYLRVDALCIIQGDDDVAQADWALCTPTLWSRSRPQGLPTQIAASTHEVNALSVVLEATTCPSTPITMIHSPTNLSTDVAGAFAFPSLAHMHIVCLDLAM